MLTIDGSEGEGGGQIIRSSLALSLITGTPFRLIKVRAGRQKPGLLRQHLTAVKAAAKIGQAEVDGASLGSGEVTFRPRTVQGGSYQFSIGTAGSATLVLQTILPALLQAEAPSEVVLEGGTHNPMAPPFDFLEKAFLPLLQRMGANVQVELLRHGFFPAGGGKFRLQVQPGKLKPLDLPLRGEIRARRALALVAHLPMSVGQRELDIVERGLNWQRQDLRSEFVKDSAGPGNVLLLEVESEHVTELFAGFGERGVLAETVAEGAVEAVRRYLRAGVPVGRYLADQLLVPMALAGSGSFRTLPLSRHTSTQIELIPRFLPVRIAAQSIEDQVCQVDVQS